LLYYIGGDWLNKVQKNILLVISGDPNFIKNNMALVNEGKKIPKFISDLNQLTSKSDDSSAPPLGEDPIPESNSGKEERKVSGAPPAIPFPLSGYDNKFKQPEDNPQSHSTTMPPNKTI
jgi:hypothetical protein